MTQTFEQPPQTWSNAHSGKPLSRKQVFEDCAGVNCVLLGESHDRADHHLWQCAVCEGLLRRHGNIALGFEMFPKRVQPILDQWSAGLLSEEAFLDNVNWKSVWGFDPALYRPLFQLCKTHRLPMLALNCERSLVSDVGKLGWDGVDPTRLKGLTPAKSASPAYRQYLFDVTGGARPDRQAKNAEDPAFDRFVRAQQVWDRAFACHLTAYHKQHPGCLLVGIMGSGHLEYFGGTPAQLDDLGLTSHVVLLPVDEPEIPKGMADYVFRLPENKKGSPGNERA